VSHDPLGDFHDRVRVALQAALNDAGFDHDLPPRLDAAPEGKGDFALPCFPIAKKARRPPPQIAAEIAARFKMADATALADGPYVNVTISSEYLAKAALGALQAMGDRFGEHPAKNVKVIVEHTSANPNGPFHVGRARNPIIGDSIARVLKAAGFDVATEYYVNDMGKQVVLLTWGKLNLKPTDVAPSMRTKADHALVSYYQKAHELAEGEAEVERAVNDMLRRFESGDKNVAKDIRSSVDAVLGGMRESLARLNVMEQHFAWESQHVLGGSVNEVVATLKATGKTVEEGGAFHIEMAPYGIQGKNTKWVFVRKDGTTLYTTRDLAYHADKFKRAGPGGRVVDVLGEDHKLTVQQLNVGLHLLGEAREPEVVFYSFVSLPEGKMSTRRGRVVYLDDLMDEAHELALEEVKKRRTGDLPPEKMDEIAEIVGIGALRFNIAAVQAEKAITFRWEEALDFEGASAPFVQYSHARSASILRKAAEEKTAPRAHEEIALEPAEVRLLSTLARFPQVVADCASTLRVHPIAMYVLQLSRDFNAFYRDCPVLLAQAEVRENRLFLVKSTKTVLRNGLDLLGVRAPDTM
jgi:arginyl-tRNA synthetase